MSGQPELPDATGGEPDEGFLGELVDSVGRFMRLETTAGLLLLLATVFAMFVKNSPMTGLYAEFLALEGQVRMGAINIEKPLFLWVNDGLMAVFFLLVGLEIKREALHGHLREVRQIVFPAIGAAGGVVVPAAIYLAFTWPDPGAMQGWAVPTATDIAFALAVLAMLGSRVPIGLKVFLMTLAIIDDLIAIVVIGLFFTSKLSVESLLAAGVCVAMLFTLNRMRVMRYGPYLVVGALLWVCVLKSGVHATLAGVITALLMPSWTREDGHESSHYMIESLHPWVAFGILPLFAFVNAGIDFTGLDPARLLAPVPLGIAAGLVLGKPIGVLGFVGVAMLLRLAKPPEGVTFAQLAGVACLCGIGFTMSLFIGGLAFAEGGSGYARIDRLGILAGSFLSAAIGYAWLRMVLPDQPAGVPAAQPSH